MFLENDDIRLRALEPDDIEALYKWENDTSLWPHGSTLAPYSRYELKRFIASSHDIYELKQMRLMIESKRTRERIGAIDLYDLEPRHGRACIGVLIGSEYRGKGYGAHSLSLLIDYAFSFLYLHQLYAYVPVRNKASASLFSHSGFKELGVLGDWLKTPDGYEDVKLFSLISGLSGS